MNDAVSNLLMEYIETFIISYQKSIHNTKQYHTVYIEIISIDLVAKCPQKMDYAWKEYMILEFKWPLYNI